MTRSGSRADTRMSTSPIVSEKRRSDPQVDACVTPGTSVRRATIFRASGSATEIGVRPIDPCCSRRASDWVSFSSDFSPNPFRSRSLCSASTRRRSSIEATPSSARSRLTAFGPRPWMLSSATTAGGCFARRPSSFATLPVSISSRIFSAVLLPTPSIFCSSATDSFPRSDPCALIDCAALSYARTRNEFGSPSSRIVSSASSCSMSSTSCFSSATGLFYLGQGQPAQVPLESQCRQ